jgi:membrane associated rhomboid family serine protease
MRNFLNKTALHAYQQMIWVHTAFYLLYLIFEIFLKSGWPGLDWVDLFGLSGDTSFWLKAPWKLVTHLFVHVHFAHFFLNLLVLYFIGKELENVIGVKKWWITYGLGSLGGAIFYALASQLLDLQDRSLIGNSAANMALVFALFAIDGRRRLNFFGIVILEMRWVALVFLLLDLIGIRQEWNAGGHWAHFGGALMGWAYWYFQSEKRTTNSPVHRRPKTDDEFNNERAQRERRLNDILDKINRSGYDSLSRSEKEFLKDQSEKMG